MEKEDNRIKEIIKLAYSEAPLYVRRKEAEFILEKADVLSAEELLQKIPILEKNEAVLNNSALLSAHSLPLQIRNELQVECTSGSTGKYMEVYWKKADYQRSMLPLYVRRRKQYGIYPWDKFCYFFTGRNLGREDILYEQTPGKLGFCKSGLNEEKLIQIYRRMLEFQPIWIMGQPSMLLLLADIQSKYRLEKIESLKYIELTGEMLFETIRLQIANAFSCAIANHYGAMEVNTIAYECPYGHMHLTESTYTEVIDEQGKSIVGKEGDICITSLENKAMPLLRYRVGDRGILHRAEHCECGLKSDWLELTTGRINDFILTRQGEKINSYVFVRAIEYINSIQPQLVKQFSVTQRDYDDFLVEFVLDDDFSRKMVEQWFVKGIWQEQLKNAHYEFVFLNELYPNETGKMKYFKRNKLIK